MKSFLLLMCVVGLLSGCLYSPYEYQRGGYPHGDRGHNREGGGDRGHGGDRRGHDD